MEPITFTCDKCGKGFTSKKYANHLKKKTPCRKVKNISKKYGVYTDPIDELFKKYSELDNELLINLCNVIKTTKENKHDNAEVSSPYELLNIMCDRIDANYFIDDSPKVLDYSCGKGNIIIVIFLKYYDSIISHCKDEIEACKIVSRNIYYADINDINVYITHYKLVKICELLTKKKNIKYQSNSYVGDSLNMNIKKEWDITGFDLVFVNPPFEDKVNRNITPHKLWIDFTMKTFTEWLKKDGYLYQISPSSFSSPSSKILQLFRNKNIKEIHFNQEEYFKDVSISIAWYIIQNNENKEETNINDQFSMMIDDKLIYIPNDSNPVSLSIHRKVMFESLGKLDIKKDYVTCHNIRLKDENSSLSKIKTENHIYPIFHTNKQIWYSSLKQEFLDKKKVMWTRSGYTKPFYDKGEYGSTDLVYFVLVKDDIEGETLAHNLNNDLFKYIFKTARWSGFGNDKVFYALPKLPNKKYDNDELLNYFNLTDEEISYLRDVS